MTREEKCKLAIEKGFTYDHETGKIYGLRGNEIKGKRSGYIQITLKVFDKYIQLRGHLFAWYYINKECVIEIDHINGIRADNRICNLRSVTRQQNQWNRLTAKGYYKYTHKNSTYYHAQIYLNTKRMYLGSFKTEQEARNAYLAAKEKYHIM